ncbi:penicillin-binding transpeptidase domain-containing protein [Yinghuangia sp. YIM S10712]|uniref:penicillin-binding transpeptidase domain-containing protein n=1 Tax=Yinghuangia sp. YIM S10712 TaxID=3436930 RepID=UPI003F52AB67
MPLALSVVVTVALTGCSDDGKAKDTSQQTAQEFLAAWQAKDIAKAAALTDAPEQAKTVLTAAQGQLGLNQGEYVPGVYTKADGDKPATLEYNAKLTVQGIPKPIEFKSSVPVVEVDGKAVVHWQPTIVHPQYTEGAKFKNTRDVPDRAPILDRNGQQLAGPTPAVSISVWPAKMGPNAEAIYAALSDPVFDKDIPKLREAVAKSNPDIAVPVVTLRKDVFESKASAKLAPFGQAIVVKDITLQTSDKAKQLVGTVGTATAEILQKEGYQNATAEDQVGVTGLQARYQAELAGVATSKVTIQGSNGADIAVLAEVQGQPGTPLKTTLDQRIQQLAEKVIAEKNGGKTAAIVALDAKTGQILAAANNPPNGANIAFTGQYAPGSTFKTITAAALLQAGLKSADKAPCENTLVVNGQTFKNYDGLQPIPDADFRTDFAESCNTGFIAQRQRLQNDSLSKVAGEWFGIGQTWDVGASTFDGSVPAAASQNELAASMIGQGKVAASPLVMASVAATIASGTFNQPVLVTEPMPAGRLAAKPLDPAIGGELKNLMLGVVQNGTADMLKGIPGTVGAKTGTAEFVENGKVLTNGWMIAFKNDIAVAVLVEKGESGGKAAGPIVQAFLSQV